MTIARNQNTFAKRQREVARKAKAEAKRARRIERKTASETPRETDAGAFEQQNEESDDRI
jgi:hypothetical protein